MFQTFLRFSLRKTHELLDMVRLDPRAEKEEEEDHQEPVEEEKEEVEFAIVDDEQTRLEKEESIAFEQKMKEKALAVIKAKEANNAASEASDPFTVE